MTPSRLDRSLRLFTDVRPGEGRTAFLLFLNAFLVLCAYYFVKPLREGWIAVSDIGDLSKMEVKAYTSFGQSLLLLPVVAWYGSLSDRYRRSDLIARATVFCMSNLVVFWFLQPQFFFEYLPFAGIAFFLWVGMFGVFIVAQFFAFAADLYTDERGRRLLPFIALGATAGAAFGSGITDWLVEGVRMPPAVASALGIEALRVPIEWLLMVAQLPLAASIAITRYVDRHELAEGVPTEEETGASPPPKSGRSALSLVFSSRFLLAVGIITLLLNWVNTNGENLLFRVVQEFLAEEAVEQGVTDPAELLVFTKNETTLFYGNFFFWVNIAALVLQGFVASRLLKFGGFAAILLMLPVVALLSYTAMALIPVLAIVKLMKIAENATDYSINNTARHVLWLPMSPEVTYKGKPMIDTFFARVGDGVAAVTVIVGVRMLALPTASYFVINVALVVVWLALAVVVIRGHRRLTQETSLDAAG